MHNGFFFVNEQRPTVSRQQCFDDACSLCCPGDYIPYIIRTLFVLWFLSVFSFFQLLLPSGINVFSPLPSRVSYRMYETCMQRTASQASCTQSVVVLRFIQSLFFVLLQCHLSFHSFIHLFSILHSSMIHDPFIRKYRECWKSSFLLSCCCCCCCLWLAVLVDD